MKGHLWLVYTLITTVLWGVWGAFSSLPVEFGFPDTLIYCVWALTMIPPALVALYLIDWKLDYDKKSIYLGMLAGLLGAGGQLILFQALTIGPAYLIFPVISLAPVVTIALAFLFLRERTGWLGGIGIVLAIIALQLFEYSAGEDGAGFEAGWFILALIILVAWGVQYFFMRFANQSMQAESIFFYMTVTGLLLVPIALYQTDFSQPINWGFKGPGLAAATQILNSVGALLIVYAFRYGKAMVVSPVANVCSPLMTAVISLAVLGVVPTAYKTAGIILALIAALMLSVETDDQTTESVETAT